jgi:Fe-S-cluster containining protein
LRFSLPNIAMDCRPGCAACCIVISIHSPLPLAPFGKAAGVPCPHLDEKNYCLLFNHADRPDFCRQYQATAEFCGESTAEAFLRLAALEAATTA